jgi:2'-5' RNA ligase
MLFLGSVAPQRIQQLIQLVDDTAAMLGPFDVDIEAGGGRIAHGEGVAWLRVGPGASGVLGLADRLAGACPPGVTSGGPPRRSPSAHMTVARRASPALIDDLRRERLGDLRASWRLASLALLRSHLGPSGAHYETLSETALYAADETPIPAEEGDIPWR